ncbi:hypothetical protein NHF50_01485 [Flavobacterium sp. NRK F10]|uniref:Uncharacterized protein n=1 Tax=Flavobacterium sediminis TaxID=2201181 RepID=A0A2U8QR57_9FLAO|nr:MULTISPECIES: hypothetical protein [Flavobacterium]AWM12600.1 hypothetical protein DI487_01070 [Flavobacterium sediminis]MCO6173709.1 hypothetical protein [Flavobacterium sp. NRK F10]
MKKVLFLAAIGLFGVSCKKTEEKPATEHETPTAPEQVVQTEEEKPLLAAGCYIYEVNDENITLKIDAVGKSVSGELSYLLAEKDYNSGTFEGTLHGDTLIGIYDYHSEGGMGAREIAFIIRDNQLIEGYGELNDEGTAFKDKSQIHFTSTMPLKKANCSE